MRRQTVNAEVLTGGKKNRTAGTDKIKLKITDEGSREAEFYSLGGATETPINKNNPNPEGLPTPSPGRP